MAPNITHLAHFHQTSGRKKDMEQAWGIFRGQDWKGRLLLALTFCWLKRNQTVTPNVKGG